MKIKALVVITMMLFNSCMSSYKGHDLNTIKYDILNSDNNKYFSAVMYYGPKIISDFPREEGYNIFYFSRDGYLARFNINITPKEFKEVVNDINMNRLAKRRDCRIVKYSILNDTLSYNYSVGGKDKYYINGEMNIKTSSDTFKLNITETTNYNKNIIIKNQYKLIRL